VLRGISADSETKAALATQLRLDQIARVEARFAPSPSELGKALDNNERAPRASLQLRFGEQVAGLAVADLWSACCELLFAAGLVREGRLDHFVLDVEQVFELSYAGDLVFCIFSPEHAFAVSREEFAASLEQAVDELFAHTACPGLMRIAASWGASSLRALPYAFRFSESALT